MKIFILCALYFASGLIALTRAGAQESASAPATENPPSAASAAPSSLVARNTSVASRPVAPTLPVDPKVRPPEQTKILRIYGGGGYFDLALAEELRPRLAKALGLAQIDLEKTIPSQVTVPSKADSQRKIPVAANL